MLVTDMAAAEHVGKGENVCRPPQAGGAARYLATAGPWSSAEIRSTGCVHQTGSSVQQHHANLPHVVTVCNYV